MAFSTIYRVAAAASLSVIATGFSAGDLLAQEPSTFVIAATPGYGAEDCLAEGGECGRVVADAWCQSHGRSAAVRFGQSDSGADAAKPYFIICGD